MIAALQTSAPSLDAAGALKETRRLLQPDAPGSLGLAGVIHDRAAAPGGPPAPSPTSYAVLAPGWAGDRCGPGEIFLPMVAALFKAATPATAAPIEHILRFDVAGRGEARGDYLHSDLDAMVDDGLRALAAAAQDAGATAAAPLPIHLIGMCSGGNLALGVAGLWARLQSDDEADVAHLQPAVRTGLRAVRLVSVQAISTFPFQEMRPEELNTIRKNQNRRKTLGKLFQAESYKKLLTGRLNPTRILKNWFESEPGKKTGGPADSGSAPTGTSGPSGAAGANTSSDAEPPNRKLSRRDLLAGLILFVQKYPGALQILYADGDPEGVASIPVYEAFFQAHQTSAAFLTLPGCNHNFYGQPARAKLFPALCSFLR